MEILFYSKTEITHNFYQPRTINIEVESLAVWHVVGSLKIQFLLWKEVLIAEMCIQTTSIYLKYYVSLFSKSTFNADLCFRRVVKCYN